MSTHTPPESSKILDIYLLIAQYPMLASAIRRRMREELFRRGIITPQRFDAEVKEKAVLSQQREGIHNGPWKRMRNAGDCAGAGCGEP